MKKEVKKYLEQHGVTIDFTTRNYIIIKDKKKWELTKILIDGGVQSIFEDGEPTGESYIVEQITLKKLKLLLK